MRDNNAQPTRIILHRLQALSSDRLLNAVALTAFVTQTLHMIEHSVQMYQHLVLGLPPKLANGLLFFLDLEWNHFIFNTLYLVFLAIILVRMKLWVLVSFHKEVIIPNIFIIGFTTQSYHLIEHTYRMYEFLTTGCTPCTGILGKFFNMVHFHFFLNIVAYLPMLLLIIKSGIFKQLFHPRDDNQVKETLWEDTLKSPAPLLASILLYGTYTGYRVDIYLLGITIFTAVGLSAFLSIFEGGLYRNILDALTISLLTAMCINMSYVSALAIVLVSLFSARVLSGQGELRLNYIAFSFTLILILSSPSLAASRWGTYNLYTFFTLLLVLGLSRAAFTKTIDIVLAFIFSWIVLFIPFQLSQLASPLTDMLLTIPSSALKLFTNPLLSLIAFFIIPLPYTFPTNRWRIAYPVACATLSFSLSHVVPVDIAAFAGITLSNIAYIITSRGR
ncbi:hypothetical protein HRbin02_00215 [Candidatus Calditenuaceae archaeon HR02]|nr:hypothetical protein HRbin02_00215 [Candidatus Calditenuaceae archaeon HR02]